MPSARCGVWLTVWLTLCAGGRAGSVEFGLAFVVAVRILSAVRACGSSVCALNLCGLVDLVSGNCLAVFCACGWCFRARSCSDVLAAG